MNREDTQAWSDEQVKQTKIGEGIAIDAANNALDFINDVIENYADLAWRKMVVETQAVEIGIGRTLGLHIVPEIFNDIAKKLRKQRMPKEHAEMIRDLFIGRVVKNIRKQLNERDE